MAFKHGSKAKIYMGGTGLGDDVSGFIRSVSQTSELDTASIDVMGGSYKQSVTGLLGASMSLQGYIDGSAGGSDELFGPDGAFQSVDRVNMIYLPQGGTAGSAGYGMAAWSTSFELSTDIGDAGTFSVNLQSDVGLERGILAHAFQAEGAGGTSPSAATGWDYGTQTTDGGWAYLIVNSASSLAVTLSSSTSTNGTYTTFATFTTTSVKGSQRLSIAPTTIERYIRCVWTGTGTFAVLFGRK
jgi:hypothetical protein